MGQALYRKHRPKSLAEVVGQEHVTDTLVSALKSGRISHAYLFSGPRGVGKTSIARILAHQINDLPYDDDSQHMDIIEIDAASNNSVEDVRDLREKVYVAPSSAKYKVYIIDEVHMLSKAAFNALLKTLEEPPAHVVFILATTETHKLPDTIISRTQHYAFKPVDQAKVIAHLRYIADQEKVKIDDDALQLLASHGEGSFRDSISLLDQARSMATAGTKAAISGDQVRQLLGIAPDDAISGLITSLGQAGQLGAILQVLNQLYGQGLQAAKIAGQLGGTLRVALSAGKPLLPVAQSLQLMKALIEVPASRSPERLLEIILLESADTTGVTPVAIPPAPAPTPAPTPQIIDDVKHVPSPTPAPIHTKTAPAAAIVVPPQPTVVQPPPVPQAVQAEPAQDFKGPKVKIALDASVWPQVLDSIKKEYNTLYGVLRMSQPIFNDDGVELLFKFAFHQKRLNEVKNKKIIAGYIKQITGQEVGVTCTYNKEATAGTITASGQHAAAPAVASTQTVDAISNIFGGAEVLGT